MKSKKALTLLTVLTALTLCAGKATAQEAKINPAAIEQTEDGENPKGFVGLGAVYKSWIGGTSPTFSLGVESKHTGGEILFIPGIKHSKYYPELSYYDENADSLKTERGTLTSKINTIEFSLPYIGFEKFKIGCGAGYCWGKEDAYLIDTKRTIEMRRSYWIPSLKFKAKVSEKIGVSARLSQDGPPPMNGLEFSVGATIPFEASTLGIDKLYGPLNKFVNKNTTPYENKWVGVGTLYKTWVDGTSPSVSIGKEGKWVGWELTIIPGIKSSKHYSELSYVDNTDSLIKADGVLSSRINTIEFFNPYIGFKNFKIGAALGYSWGKDEIYLTTTKETIEFPQSYGSLTLKAKANISNRWGLNARLSYGGYTSMSGPEFGLGINVPIN